LVATNTEILIGHGGEKHKELLKEAKASFIKVNYSLEKGAYVTVRSHSTSITKNACNYILSYIESEIGRLPEAKICPLS